MKEIIDRYRYVVVQIATPYSTGTGFYLKDQHLIITNEHVVRDNREVVVEGETFEKQLARVLYIDERYDLAFLEAPGREEIPEVHLANGRQLREGEVILAIGHPFGLKYTTTQGIVSNTTHEANDLQYIQHDAALNPGNSGGPLVNKQGEIVGVNTFVIRDGDNIGFSLPIHYLLEALREFKSAKGRFGARCPSCSNIVFDDTVDKGYCPHCGARVQLPNQVEDYAAIGVAKTIEDMLTQLGHDVRLTRRGPNNWEIQEGSARISISYHEKSGLITGDAYLCLLPRENIKDLYEYLLRQNYETEGLTFSIKEKEQDIILSLLIYDRYLNVETGLQLFQHLFGRSDFYDNVLVEDFGAKWKAE